MTSGLSSPSSRIRSIDILRGLVMVIMVIDHLRDMYSLTGYSPEDLSQTSPALFFTRWITHFCAPVFVFLAGTSIFLYAEKLQNKKALSIFLLKRGIWLIFVEILIVNWAWAWVPFWDSWGFFLQVIWVIGISMVLMAGLVWLNVRTILIFSLLLIFGHNVLDSFDESLTSSLGPIWNVFHRSAYIQLNPTQIYGTFIAYPLIPWLGVMGAGYAFGQCMTWPAPRRMRTLRNLGIGCLALFLVLRGLNIYGDPVPWSVQETSLFTVLSFLNTAKYPPSLAYLLMTLGPAFFALILFERWENKGTEALRVFGRVPFFYYILHLVIPHALSIVYFKLEIGEWFDLPNTSGSNWPAAYHPSLVRLYLVWVITIVGLYFPCRWFMRYKAQNPQKWLLKYL